MAESQKPPSRTADQFVVRFPDGMRDRIADQAQINNRSMNAEIVSRLEQSFDGPVKQSEVEALLQKLHERDEKEEKAAVRDHLLSLSAMVLRLVTERLPASDDKLTEQLMELAKRYSNAVIHYDFDQAMQAAISLMDFGVRYGIVQKDVEGEAFPALPEYKGPRRSPIVFPEPIEGAPSPPSKSRRKLKI